MNRCRHIAFAFLLVIVAVGSAAAQVSCNADYATQGPCEADAQAHGDCYWDGAACQACGDQTASGDVACAAVTQCYWAGGAACAVKIATGDCTTDQDTTCTSGTCANNFCCTNTDADCTACDNAGACTTCTTGTLTGGWCIQAVGAACTNDGQCTSGTCGTNCCTNTDADCTTCDNAGDCTACATGTNYIPDATGVCTPKIATGSACTASPITECAAGDSLCLTLCCTAAHANCATCDNAGACATCAATHYISAPDTCTTKLTPGTACTASPADQCDSGVCANLFCCTNADADCATCDNTGACTSCTTAGNYVGSVSGVCTAPIVTGDCTTDQNTACTSGQCTNNFCCTNTDADCTACDNTGTCQGCTTGTNYIPDATGVCTAKLNNGIACTGSPIDECSSGDNYCKNSVCCTATNGGTADCTACGTAGACTACTTGYVASATGNCATKLTPGSVCTADQSPSCDSGSCKSNVCCTANNGGDTDCTACGAAGACTTCTAGYVVTATNECATKITDGTACTGTPADECDSGVCANLFCCTNTDANCATCDNTGVCTACAATHYLDANAACQTKLPYATPCTTDVECMSGACLTTCCTTAHANCATCDNNGDCIACLENFYLEATSRNCTATGATRTTQGTDFFYAFFAGNPQSWSEAKAFCETNTPGYLAVIHSAEENQFAFDAAATAATGIWLGAKDDAVEGDWRWEVGPQIGEMFWTGDSSGTCLTGYFCHWESGEPNGIDGSENCAAQTGNSDMKWNDLSCTSSTLEFACQYPVLKTDGSDCTRAKNASCFSGSCKSNVCCTSSSAADDKCTACGTDGVCTSCATGYMLAVTGECIAKLVDGAACIGPPFDGCASDVCAGGFCCSNGDPNCNACDDTGGCTGCTTGTLTSGWCLVYAGMSCSVNEQCTSGMCPNTFCCSSGDPQCTSCDNTGACTATNVIGDGEACTGAVECSSGSGNCKNNVCCTTMNGQDANCAACGANGACTACLGNYYLESATGICVGSGADVTVRGATFFYAFFAVRRTWADAKTSCETNTPGYLAVIRSNEENKFVSEAVASAEASVWIGAKDDTTEGEWRWEVGPDAGHVFWSGGESGSCQSSSFCYWGSGQPNNIGEEDCGSMNMGATTSSLRGYWSDGTCTTTLEYVCQYPILDSETDCSDGGCETKLGEGAACTSGTDCASGSCKTNCCTNDDTECNACDSSGACTGCTSGTLTNGWCIVAPGVACSVDSQCESGKCMTNCCVEANCTTTCESSTGVCKVYDRCAPYAITELQDHQVCIRKLEGQRGTDALTACQSQLTSCLGPAAGQSCTAIATCGIAHLQCIGNAFLRFDSGAFCAYMWRAQFERVGRGGYRAFEDSLIRKACQYHMCSAEKSASCAEGFIMSQVCDFFVVAEIETADGTPLSGTPMPTPNPEDRNTQQSSASFVSFSFSLVVVLWFLF